VERDLSIPGRPEVYVIGDAASVTQDGAPVPGVARAAIDAGVHAAANIQRRLAGKATLPFHYTNRGSLATIGRGAAIADLGRVKLSGFVAWLAWLFIHILFLIGFRNRLAVVLQWAFAYITFDRGARLITGELPRATVKVVASPASLPEARPGDTPTPARGLLPKESVGL
jgi:NADH dehydrogenase